MVYGNTSPRKVVPLRGEEDSGRTTGRHLTTRAFFCGVVVEESEHAGSYSQEVQDLVSSLGRRLPSECGRAPRRALSTDGLLVNQPIPQTRRRALTNSSALADRIDELIATERSYVRKLQIIKYDYADPVRSFGRNKDTALLPLYDAKILFGNIDSILPVNEAFLRDLETMIGPGGARAVGGVGDVALRHFKDLGAFDCYRLYYSQREKAQSILERETSRKSSSGFGAFIDRIQYSNADVKVGLGQLLMEPVQRIPRYTMMFRNIMKYMNPDDPQLRKLKEADELASRIALAETDEQTRHGTILYCLGATIDGFPPDLIKPSRTFIDCIDVEDVSLDAPHPSSSQASLGSTILHTTLFLFDDKLLIVKRPGNGDKGGRSLSGLDDIERLGNVGIHPRLKKSGLCFKGVADISAVVVTDVGGPDLHLFLESPPQDIGERWSDRPFRTLSVVHPPWNVDLDPVRTRKDKARFLENLWAAQARYRAREGQSVILQSDEMEVEVKGDRKSVARTYYNIYQRTAFLKELVKTKVVVQVDAGAKADPIPFGHNSAPFVVIRIHPHPRGVSRFTVTDIRDTVEEETLSTCDVPSRIVQTIHNYGLFKFRTGVHSAPGTPAASTRSRAAIFGLDVIPRNFFNVRPGSSKGDPIGNSIYGHRRTKSNASRTSAYTETTVTESDSLMERSHRSNSTVTAATTISTCGEDASLSSRKSTSLSRSRKLIKRNKSPGSSRSRSASRDRDSGYSDTESLVASTNLVLANMDDSEWDLSQRLELARRNSKNQSGPDVARLIEKPVEDTIYEDEPLDRRSSRASRDTRVGRSTTPVPLESSLRRRTPDSNQQRPSSIHSTERRPMGPRTPSPLPPRSPRSPAFSVDVELALETTLMNVSRPLPSVIPLSSFALADSAGPSSPLPRSQRQPLVPTGNTPNPITPVRQRSESPSKAIEPLSIRKKNSVHEVDPLPVPPSPTPTPTRRSYGRGALARTSNRMQRAGSGGSPLRTGSLSGTGSLLLEAKVKRSVVAADEDMSIESLTRLAETTREDVASANRAVKRIRLEASHLKTKTATGTLPTIESPSKSPPSGGAGGGMVRHGTVTKAALERMEEMRMMIGMRHGDSPGPVGRVRGGVRSTTPVAEEPVASGSRGEAVAVAVDAFVSTVDMLVGDATDKLDRASANQDALAADMRGLALSLQERAAELARGRLEVQNAKRQCEVVKSLLEEATAEKEIMYAAFNEELNKMFEDVQLPATEAWAAMSNDLRETKGARNELERENTQLKRRLADVEMEKEGWGKLLRAHGLIP